MGSYGSILATPPQQPYREGSDAASFELPDPALDPDETFLPPEERPDRPRTVRTPSPVMDQRIVGNMTPSPSQPMDTYPEQRQTHQSPMSGLTKVSSSTRGSQLLRRVFTAEGEPGVKRAQETSQSAEIEKRQDDFFKFLDNELHKIDSFYLLKEQEATEKLRVLRQQLHVMRDQRMEEVLASKRAAKPGNADGNPKPNGFAKLNNNLKDTLVGKSRFGKNSEALAQMATPGIPAQDREFIVNRRDFMRRQEPPSQEVSYRSAKRKLKHALQEFYRGVELLKGYAYLNRTAFRKINKKYDKAVNARPPLRYMSDKVNKASFVQSELTESLMIAVEDLYARYFERGNRKIAVSKLRHTIHKTGDFSPNTFRSGLLLMGGTLFSIKAVVDATHNLHSGTPAEQVQTSYLLQVGSETFSILIAWLT